MIWFLLLYVAPAIFAAVYCIAAIREQGHAKVSDILASLAFTLIPVYNVLMTAVMIVAWFNDSGIADKQIWKRK